MPVRSRGGRRYCCTATLTHQAQPAQPGRTALRSERLGRSTGWSATTSASRKAYEDALRAVVPDEPSTARAPGARRDRAEPDAPLPAAASRGYAEQAIAVGRAGRRAAHEAHARNTLGCDLAALGHDIAGIGLLEEALAMVRRAGDEAEVGRCLINLTENLAIARRCADAVRVGDAGVAEAARLGLARVHGPVILGDALLSRYLLGQWDEVEQLCGDALDTEPAGMSAVPLRLARARVALARGMLDGAAEDLIALRAILDGTDDLQYGAQVIALRAGLAAAQARHAEARAVLRGGLARTADHNDMALHLELAARAVSIEADAFDTARLTGRRTDPVAARAAAGRIVSAADAMTARIVAAGGRRSPVLALLAAVAQAHLSRIQVRAARSCGPG